MTLLKFHSSELSTQLALQAIPNSIWFRLEEHYDLQFLLYPVHFCLSNKVQT